MNKKHLLENARKLYVHELYNFLEIAKKIKVSERTIRSWASKNNWDAEREQFLEKANGIYSDRIIIAQMLGKRIKDKLKKGEEPSAAELNSYRSLTDGLQKVKQFDKNEQHSSGDIPNITEATKQSLKQTFGE